MITCGIDIGSVSAEAVILTKKPESCHILSYAIIPTGSNSKTAARKVFKQAVDNAGITPEDINKTVATGYGRINVDFAHKSITEITCHARGALYYYPQTRLVIDIGGQDSKVIRLDENSNPFDFLMNDKCAAGTGRFLEVMAHALEIDITHFGEIFLSTKEKVDITSTCTVFAESEIVSLIGHGVDKNKIIKGLVYSIAHRVNTMIDRVGFSEPVCMTGGVAKNTGVVKALEETLDSAIYIPEDPQIVGALGAALMAMDIK
ncbi:MAG: acyl-CoA dehydratase activase [Actinomycetota bacterium]|jgi:predicted CoA-substrate-specific enzyme activase|nr:acyl-CoA dehydratase activase [Actinomycetota bacterium]